MAFGFKLDSGIKRVLIHSARVLIVDDYEPWRRFVCSILNKQPNLQIVGEACDGAQAVQKATEQRPNIVLIDIAMPALNGIEAAKQIRQNSPDSKIIFLTQTADEDIKKAALETGADGYVLKANAASDLLPAIAAALCNGHR